MKYRCNSPSCKDYPLYGGRGIGYTPDWKSYETFLMEMGEPPAGLSLDRIDNSLGYSKENCRWATASQQRRNQRPKPLKLSKENVEKLFELLRAGLSKQKIADALGIHRDTVYAYLRRQHVVS